MARLICLANSWRPGGRCVAGIDCATGQWVRPVPFQGGAIREERTWLGGNCIALLDMIEAHSGPGVRHPLSTRKLPRAKLELAARRPRRGGRRHRLLHYAGANPAQPGQNCRAGRDGAVASPAVDVPGTGRGKRGGFSARSVPTTSLAGPVLDGAGGAGVPSPGDRSGNDPAPRAGERIAPHCLLTVSLTVPIEIGQFHKPKLCYKLVAGVIELE